MKSKKEHGFYGTGSNTGQVAAELFKVRTGLDTTYVNFSPIPLYKMQYTNKPSGIHQVMSFAP